MHGRGVYTWKDGRRYEGEYQHDKKHGHGIYTWADGRKYDGPWAHGKLHGKGKYILPDGTMRIGLWDNGKRTKWLDEEEGTQGGSPDRNFGGQSSNLGGSSNIGTTSGGINNPGSTYANNWNASPSNYGYK